MTLQRPSVTGSPLTIAATYGVFGLLWIVLSDLLVVSVFDDPTVVTTAQTVKGWLFVAISTGLIYALVRTGRLNLERTNDELDGALQQTSILDRLLRHNLRNSCNVIQANATMIQEGGSKSEADCLRTIQDHNKRLLDLSEKSRTLRDIVLTDSVPGHRLDLVGIIESEIAVLRESHPTVEFETDLPAEAVIEAHSRIRCAIAELLENAVQHNESGETSVRVSLETDPTADRISITIEDNGTGLPPIEQRVLEKGFETQLTHSQGLGLWIARLVIDRHGGEFTIRENNPSGTIVELSLPTSQA